MGVDVSIYAAHKRYIKEHDCSPSFCYSQSFTLSRFTARPTPISAVLEARLVDWRAPKMEGTVNASDESRSSGEIVATNFMVGLSREA